MSRRLFLISNSTNHGERYLEHCEAALRDFLGAVERVLFVPYALHDREGYAAAVRARFEEMGFALDSLHVADDPVAAVGRAEAVFVGGGNTFRLLSCLYELRLVEPLRRRVAGGMPYLGASAGTNMSCPTIKTTNDMPIVEPESFRALGLLPFQINPHYLDPAPASTHMGETRETRLREFLQENDVAVVGLREGTLLRIEDDRIELVGPRPARVFRRGHEPLEVQPGGDLRFLLS